MAKEWNEWLHVDEQNIFRKSECKSELYWVVQRQLTAVSTPLFARRGKIISGTQLLRYKTVANGYIWMYEMHCVVLEVYASGPRNTLHGNCDDGPCRLISNHSRTTLNLPLLNKCYVFACALQRVIDNQHYSLSWTLLLQAITALGV